MLTQTGVALTKGAGAIGDGSSTYLALYKTAMPVIPQWGASYNNFFLIHNSYFKLFQLDGIWNDTQVQNGYNYNNYPLHWDVVFEGTYELDPTWFNT
jgi:hypothetical protein